MSEIRQKAEGENITQAGRDININAPMPVVTENLIHCPRCQYAVSPHAEACVACGHPVRQHFENNYRKSLGKRYSKWTIICGLPGLIGLIGGQYLDLPAPWGKYLMFGSLALLGLALLFAKTGENIEKGIR